MTPIEEIVNRVIAPDDDMCAGNPEYYFRVGREALTLIEAARARQAGDTPVESLLDYPCGYGRVARWLRAGFPFARLTAADTHAPAVGFCVAQFGATGVHARLDDRHWSDLPGPCDVIWCGSLLTHFDAPRWAPLLRHFAERLSPRGVLLFTTHGRRCLRGLEQHETTYGLPPDAVATLCAGMTAGGFGYVNYPTVPAYGISLAQPTWVRALIEQETALHVLDHHETAWGGWQDVVVCGRRD